MKTLSEIIEEVQDGGRPDYDDLRYALVAMNALRHFDASAINKLYQRERDGKYKKELFGLEWAAHESFNRFKAALAVPPKQYVGVQHDPDTEECQRFRRMAKGIINHVLKPSRESS